MLIGIFLRITLEKEKIELYEISWEERPDIGFYKTYIKKINKDYYIRIDIRLKNEATEKIEKNLIKIFNSVEEVS